MRTPKLALLLVAGGCLFSQPVFSDQAADDARAAELKKKGDAAMDTLHYDDALAAYTEAYALSHNAALLYNRGRVYQARGDFPAALADIERFDREASADLHQRVPKLGELLAELRQGVSTVTFASKLQGARVVVRNQVLGTTPLPGPVKLNAGAATIEVTLEGYFPLRRDVVLPKGGELTVQADLEPKATRGQLVVDAKEGANVIVDGQALGGPHVETVLDPGQHKVVGRKEGFDEATTTVVIAAGERKEIALDLKKSPPITSRWWFWGGIGAVVAGGVVAVIVLRPERAPSAGDKFTPGSVSASLVKW